MADLQHIKQRIEQIRREIEQDPDLARELERRSRVTHEAVHRAEETMRSAKVIPISKGRRKNADLEVDL